MVKGSIKTFVIMDIVEDHKRNTGYSEAEILHILLALRAHGWNCRATSRTIGVHHATINRIHKRHKDLLAKLPPEKATNPDETTTDETTKGPETKLMEQILSLNELMERCQGRLGKIIEFSKDPEAIARTMKILQELMNAGKKVEDESDDALVFLEEIERRIKIKVNGNKTVTPIGDSEEPAGQ